MCCYHIILTDYSPEVGELLVEILSVAGYCVRFDAPSEFSACRIREAHPDLAMIELLPNAPGPILALVGHLRADPATAHLPVLVTSTDYMLLKHMAKTLDDLGCRTLMKPFSMNELLDVVRAAIGAGASAESL